jgi:hypothetical protein
MKHDNFKVSSGSDFDVSSSDDSYLTRRLEPIHDLRDYMATTIILESITNDFNTPLGSYETSTRVADTCQFDENPDTSVNDTDREVGEINELIARKKKGKLAFPPPQSSAASISPYKKRPTGLRNLTNFADFFALPTRKVIKALAGDYDAEIRRLRQARRPFAARWNMGLAWGVALWYVLRSPVDRVLQYLIKSFKGGG